MTQKSWFWYVSLLLDKPAVQKPAVVSQKSAAVQHKAQPTKKHQQMLNIVQDNIISLKTLN